ncbi:unnamed protein product [Albugo candida]|uniref:Uncharacterized protein n=1 Tax=Albugo candida TaxID=65357 RepID=A0A024FXM1_9STRA|nr:unnamed protein product [Albugo candida]|eukprot:CCI11776.1 unnamed protein product [Albugo candida]
MVAIKYPCQHKETCSRIANVRSMGPYNLDRSHKVYGSMTTSNLPKDAILDTQSQKPICARSYAAFLCTLYRLERSHTSYQNLVEFAYDKRYTAKDPNISWAVFTSKTSNGLYYEEDR